MKRVNGYTVFNFNEYKQFKDSAFIEYPTVTKEFGKDKVRVYSTAGCGFDIETTRVDEKGHFAYMWCWQFVLGKYIIIGRKWEQFEELVEDVKTWLNGKYIICWVANLSHEFMFMKKRIPITDVFATKVKHPITAFSGTLEFRDCLYLSGIGGLKNLAKNYTTTQKAVGDLDYDKPRNSVTPITEKELGYIVNDVAILTEYSDYCYKTFGSEIPLTATGIPRSMVRKEVNGDKMIMEKVFKLFPFEVSTYNMEMEYLFRGGFTHASVWYAGFNEPVKNVFGVDFTSSYPAQMLHHKFPMTPFYPCSKTFKGRIKIKWSGDIENPRSVIDDERIESENFAVKMVCHFHNLRPKTMHSIESKSKLLPEKLGGINNNLAVDNGRIAGAEDMTVLITDVDYKIYRLFYEWDYVEVLHASQSRCEALPEYLLKPLRLMYELKCKLKREGKDGTPEYQNAKAAVNSFYGMCVTRLYLAEIGYCQEYDVDDNEDGWEEVDGKTYYILKKNQFLSPYWGIWITSWARYELLTTVYKIDPDMKHHYVVYCDTDSIYMIDTPRNRKIIEEYNNNIYEMNKGLSEYFYDIGAFDEIMSKGDKTHGGYYFKTLGAKRYIKYKNGHVEVTVAGMRKGTLEEYMAKEEKEDETDFPIYKKIEDPETGEEKTIELGFVNVDKMFETFTDNFILGTTESKKNASAYNNKPHAHRITDEFGNTEDMFEFSSLAIYPIKFELRLDDLYVMYMLEIAETTKRKMLYDKDGLRKHKNKKSFNKKSELKKYTFIK